MAGELIKARDVLKIGQRVEFFVEASDERHTSRIEGMTDEELIVAMPMNSKHVPIIPLSGSHLYGVAIGKQCRYRFFTSFHETGMLDERIAVWYISFPEKVERHQNREFVRVKVNLPVQVRLIDEEGTIQAPVMTRMIDLSGNGICFAMEQEVKPGTKAALSLSSIPGVGPTEQMCKVASCRKIEKDAGEFVYHIGAAFQHLPRAVSNQIVHYLFAVQRATIAKGINKNDL